MAEASWRFWIDTLLMLARRKVHVRRRGVFDVASVRAWWFKYLKRWIQKHLQKRFLIPSVHCSWGFTLLDPDKLTLYVTFLPTVGRLASSVFSLVISSLSSLVHSLIQFIIIRTVSASGRTKSDVSPSSYRRTKPLCSLTPQETTTWFSFCFLLSFKSSSVWLWLCGKHQGRCFTTTRPNKVTFSPIVQRGRFVGLVFPGLQSYIRSAAAWPLSGSVGR